MKLLQYRSRLLIALALLLLFGSCSSKKVVEQPDSSNTTTYLGSKAFGIKHDLISKEKAFSLSGNVLTCNSCSFQAEDIGKAVYLEQVFWLGHKLEKAPYFGGTVDRFAQLPSPTARKVWKVQSANDDPHRKDLEGAQYYAAVGKKWAYLNNYSDMWFSITEYIGPSQVKINYSAPSPLKELTGKYGTNNWETWLRLCQRSLKNGTNIALDSGPFGLFQSDKGEHRLNLRPSSKGRALSIRGNGPEQSIIHYHYTPDTMAFEPDPTKADNAFLHGFYGVDFADSQIVTRHSFSNFRLIGNTHASFRGVDGRSRRTFAFSDGAGTVEFKNMEIIGGDGWYYCGGNWQMKATKVTYDGLQQAEVGIQQFSSGSIHLENCVLKNIGPPNAYATFTMGERGRSFYVRPETAFTAINCRFRNINGRGQFYSGGSKDQLDDPTIKQHFEKCEFLWDKTGISGMGIYTSRVQQPSIIDCKFQATNGGKMQRGILVSSGATIRDCFFDNGYALSNGTNVGSNTVYPKNQAAQTRVENCTFQNAQVDLQSVASQNAPHEFFFENCSFQHTTQKINTGQMIRIIGKNPAKEALTTATFNNCKFRGVLPGKGPKGTPILFCEPNGKVKLFFKNTLLRMHSDNGRVQQVYLAKQLRGAVELHLENCTILPDDTLRVDIDPYTGEKGAKFFGSNNDIKHILYTTDTPIAQAYNLKSASCPKPLIAAKTLKGLQLNFDTYTVKGSIPIQYLGLFENKQSGQILKSSLRIIASGKITFQTGGNIAIDKAFSLKDGAEVRFQYDPKTGKFKPER